MATIAVFPEPGAWGPTNNLVAITEPLRERGHRVVFVVEESFAGELERRGFEEALMRMAPAARGARGRRRGLGRVHPHDRAGVPQADARAARDGDHPDLGRARRRRALRARAHARDLGRGAPRRRRRRQRDRLPRDPAGGRAVGADGVGQPARAARSRPAPGVLRLPRRRRGGLGRVPRRVRPAERAAAGRALRVQRARRGRRAPRRPVPVRLALAEHVPVPGRGRLRAGGAARADLAPDRLDRPHLGPGVRRRQRCPATAA